jgi:hypothetical protein
MFGKVSQMQKAGLTAIVMNSDTLDAARRVGRCLWEEARSKVTLVRLIIQQVSFRDTILMHPGC